MSGPALREFRLQFHNSLVESVLRVDGGGVPNNADGGSAGSVEISRRILRRIGAEPIVGRIAPQTRGKKFEGLVRDFLRVSFSKLLHLRPGEWQFDVGTSIGEFAQYRHLDELQRLIASHGAVRTAFQDYIVVPDVVVSRRPVHDSVINARGEIVGESGLAAHTPVRSANCSDPLLHASVSCKWTIRSDRSQNARTEALNLIRNRKGHSPHVSVVTAEPMPSRIASLALGTGDIDCVYHFALPELQWAVSEREADEELLSVMVDGGRLRDISDLPLDLIA